MATADEEREAAMANYRRKLLTHRVGGRGPDARDNAPPLPQNPVTDVVVRCSAGFPAPSGFRLVVRAALSNLSRRLHRAQQFPGPRGNPRFDGGSVRGRWRATYRSCTTMHEHPGAVSDLRPVPCAGPISVPSAPNPNDRASCRRVPGF